MLIALSTGNDNLLTIGKEYPLLGFKSGGFMPNMVITIDDNGEINDFNHLRFKYKDNYISNSWDDRFDIHASILYNLCPYDHFNVKVIEANTLGRFRGPVPLTYFNDTELLIRYNKALILCS